MNPLGLTDLLASSPLSRKSHFLRGFSYLTVLQIVWMGVRLLASAIILRYFGPSNKGILAIATSILGIASLANLQTGQAVQAFIPKLLNEKGFWSVRILLWQAYLIRAVLVVLISAALYILAPWAANFYRLAELTNLVRVLAATNLIAVLTGPVDQSILIALKQYRQVFFMGLLSLTGFMIAVGATVTFHLGMDGYLWAMGMAPLLSFGYLWFCFFSLGRQYPWRQCKPSELPARVWFERLLRFSLPVSATGILYQLSTYMGTLVAGRLFATDVVGLYSFAAIAINRLWSVVSLPESLFIPRFAEARLKGQEALAGVVNQAWRGMLVYAGVTSAMVLIFAAEITRLLAGSEFLGAVPILQLLAVQSVFRSMSSTRIVFYAEEVPVEILKRYVVKLLSELLGYVAFIPVWGIMGLVLSNVLSYLVWGLIISFGAFDQLCATAAARITDFFHAWVVVGGVVVLLMLAHTTISYSSTILENEFIFMIAKLLVWGTVALAVALTMARRERVFDILLSLRD